MFYFTSINIQDICIASGNVAKIRRVLVEERAAKPTPFPHLISQPAVELNSGLLWCKSSYRYQEGG